jgi:hypothetical protein
MDYMTRVRRLDNKPWERLRGGSSSNYSSSLSAITNPTHEQNMRIVDDITPPWMKICDISFIHLDEQLVIFNLLLISCQLKFDEPILKAQAQLTWPKILQKKITHWLRGASSYHMRERAMVWHQWLINTCLGFGLKFENLMWQENIWHEKKYDTRTLMNTNA